MHPVDSHTDVRECDHSAQYRSITSEAHVPTNRTIPPKKKARHMWRAFFFDRARVSRIPVDASAELRIHFLAIGHGEVDVLAVRQTALEVSAGREDVVRRAAVLPNEPAQIAETLA